MWVRSPTDAWPDMESTLVSCLDGLLKAELVSAATASGHGVSYVFERLLASVRLAGDAENVKEGDARGGPAEVPVAV